MQEIRTLRSTRRGSKHGAVEWVSLADGRASQQRTQLRPQPARHSPTPTVRGGDGDIPTYSAFRATQGREHGVEGALLGKAGEISEEDEAAG